MEISQSSRGKMEDGEEVVYFYGLVRESAIALLSAVSLCFASYSIVERFLTPSVLARARPSQSRSEEQTVNTVVVGVCTLSLAVALGSGVLLLFSVVGSEVHRAFPHSAYTQWLDRALFTGLWNHLFLVSNVCLLLLLPFGHFFMESEGFSWSRKGLWSKVYESSVVVVLTVALLGLVAWVAYSLWQQGSSHYSEVWAVHHNVYSVIALCGVLVSTVCAPLGICRSFDILNTVLTQPRPSSPSGKEVLQLQQTALERELLRTKQEMNTQRETLLSVEEQLHDLAINSSHGVVYPLVFCVLLFFTVVSFVLVGLNCVSLLFTAKDFLRHTESYRGVAVSLTAGVTQLLVLLSFGPSMLLGFYSIPGLKALLPRKHGTPLATLLVNCGVWLVCGSALPLLLSTLGLTRFKLLGNFLSFPWLDSVALRLAYNCVFEALTCLILTQKVSLAVVRQLPAALSWRTRRTRPLTQVKKKLW